MAAVMKARTLWGLVAERAAATPDQLMLISAEGEAITFAAFAERAEVLAAGLAEQGIGEGSRVSWQLPTQISSVLLSMALARLGALQNPIIHLYRERELGFAVRQTASQWLFLPGIWRGTDYLDMAERALGNDLSNVQVIDVSLGLPEGDPANLPPFVEAEELPVRWIYYTSGSTSEPKGVQHSDGGLLAGGRGLADALAMSASDIGSIAFPYAHIGGPDYLVTMLTHGFPAVLLEAFNPVEALELFNQHQVTMVGGSTAFYLAYLAEQRKQPDQPILPSLRLMSGGGAAKPPEVHYEVMREIGGRGVVHGYGMTECPMIANGSPHDSDEQLANTDGAPVTGCQVRIVSLDGQEAKAGSEGEVRVKGPMVFLGYTDPTLNAEAFDEEGWFRTGDLGILREDGHVSLTGRLKDVIVRKGENISAKEIEDLLYTHPGVKEVAVIGVPDAERGEMVVAVVEPSDAAAAPDLPAIVSFLKDAGLMMQKIPERLEIRSDWPRAGTGKIVKKDLREQYSL